LIAIDYLVFVIFVILVVVFLEKIFFDGRKLQGLCGAVDGD